MIDTLSPDTLALIAWLAGRGSTAEEIAGHSRVKIDPAQVRFIVDRLDLPRLTQSQDPVPLRLTIPRELLAVLDRGAVKRKIGRADMAEAILKTVLNDGMVDAVMDDDTEVTA